MSNDNTLASLISWTPGCGIQVAKWGKQNERGAAGVEELYIVSRRTSRGRQYGLAWVDGAVVARIDHSMSALGECCAWPWGADVSNGVTWMPSRKAAFATARTI
jgi:hypothetical protein